MSIEDDDSTLQQVVTREGREGLGEDIPLVKTTEGRDEPIVQQMAAVVGRGGTVEGESQVENETLERRRQRGSYNKNKTVAEGVMDIGLIVATVSQFKAVLDTGNSHDYFYPIVILTTICFALQVAVGILILCLLTNEEDNEDDDKSSRLNRYVVILIFVITVFNIVIGVFGLSAPKSLISNPSQNKSLSIETK